MNFQILSEFPTRTSTINSREIEKYIQSILIERKFNEMKPLQAASAIYARNIAFGEMREAKEL